MKYLSLVISLVLTVMIFLFSSASGTDSGAVSGSITQSIIDWISPLIAPVTLDFDITHLILRKLAHVSEYLLLGISYAITLHLFKQPLWVLAVAGVLIALADEASQFLSDDRGPSLLDALLFDIPGYLIGASVTKWLLIKKRSKLNVS